MPYESQQSLAWAASFVMVMMILAANLGARWISHATKRS
jgi:phosphate transport system permease protein